MIRFIPLDTFASNGIGEREMDKTDIPGPLRRSFSEASTFNAGATLGPVNETNMARIWNKHKQTNTPLKRKVFVGMSGGVDSSVAAALLKQQGFNVIGVFIHFWAEEIKGKVRDNICCSLEAQEDARRVCQKLDIPFFTMNLKESFKKNIVDDFVKTYGKGETPNPCVRCNRFIKFGEFIKRAKLLGADFVATGHYAQIKKAQSPKSKFPSELRLLKGADKQKDQSYFLNQLTQAQLKQILFPVGHLTKDKVRALAKKFGLAVASKKESQEVCFIVDNRLDLFLQRNLTLRKGEMREVETGKVLGKHQGLALYTIGQRRGIGLPGGPWYVVLLEDKKNILWISKDERNILNQEMKVGEINWIKGIEPKLPLKVKCRVRYRAKDATAEIVNKKNGVFSVKFTRPERAITPGQYAVFYKGQECLGGGVIAKMLLNDIF